MVIGILDFFHSLVKGRRKRLKVTRIQNSQRDWLEDEGEIAREAVDHFQKKFRQERDATSFPQLSHIPEMITEEENEDLR